MRIVLLSLATGALGYLSALLYLLVQGHWWEAGSLCLTAVGLRYGVKACKEPWHGGPH